MKLLKKNLLKATVLALGISALALPATINGNEAKAADLQYGLTSIGNSIVTVKDNSAELYNALGQPINQKLSENSSWKTNLENTISNGNYFGVGKNEYLKASDVNFLMNEGASKYGQISSTPYDGVVITNLSGATVYDAAGKASTKILPAGSAWKVGTQNNLPSGTYFQIGANEYVKGNDVRVYQETLVYPIKEDITLRSGSPITLYDKNGQVLNNKTLSPDSSWYSDEFADIGHVGYYRVANNEYVCIVDVQA
ncbi:SLAP domain-containing protein [Companilactobacillus halodurans]|uniref:S-layer protein C-terminal domain-containing protein n=1 Tax=Companilactobacillus halodurans TaxID=2584183 RepID=A0A5P0ZXU3_9LACO|nr:SLAP domain-containing protein [Companilactobacillus halodurans]MQS75542.1 hypothetical protein [Companilactobacillus halodurans]MQS97787.1 hypothetical protein [Companilactobacillus halodurans]